MRYNDTKFVLLIYSNDENLKNDYVYFIDGMKEIIEPHKNQHDLGIEMSNNGNFDFHIDNIIKKAKQGIGWISRTFQYREAFFMKRMYTTFVRLHLDYCYQLWNPCEGSSLDKLEKVRLNFTNLIPEISHLDYCNRLKFLNLTLIQRYQKDIK